jgi:hypothetical protein
VIPAGNERYTSLVLSTKISEFLDAEIQRYEINIADCSEKQHSRDTRF